MPKPKENKGEEQEENKKFNKKLLKFFGNTLSPFLKKEIRKSVFSYTWYEKKNSKIETQISKIQIISPSSNFF